MLKIFSVVFGRRAAVVSCGGGAGEVGGRGGDCAGAGTGSEGRKGISGGLGMIGFWVD